MVYKPPTASSRTGASSYAAPRYGTSQPSGGRSGAGPAGSGSTGSGGSGVSVLARMRQQQLQAAVDAMAPPPASKKQAEVKGPAAVNVEAKDLSKSLAVQLAAEQKAVNTTISEELPKQEIPVSSVVVDPLVALKIAKHAREAASVPVAYGSVAPSTAGAGILLGLNSDDGVLSISHSFNMPTASSDDAGSRVDIRQYQLDLMQCLREVNVDCNTVGWYQTIPRFGASFLTEHFLDIQANYQSILGSNTIVLVYDTARAEQAGHLGLRAFRLDDQVVALLKTKEFSTKRLIENKITHDSMLQELPLTVRGSSLVDVLINELDFTEEAEQDLDTELGIPAVLAPPKKAAAAAASSSKNQQRAKDASLIGQKPTSRSTASTTLDITLDTDLEVHLDSLLSSMEEFGQDIGRHNYWRRGAQREMNKANNYIAQKKLENEYRASQGQEPLPIETEAQLATMFRVPPEPSRLPSLLASARAHQAVRGIENIAGRDLTKLYTAAALQ